MDNILTMKFLVELHLKDKIVTSTLIGVVNYLIHK